MGRTSGQVSPPSWLTIVTFLPTVISRPSGNCTKGPRCVTASGAHLGLIQRFPLLPSPMTISSCGWITDGLKIDPVVQKDGGLAFTRDDERTSRRKARTKQAAKLPHALPKDGWRRYSTRAQQAPPTLLPPVRCVRGPAS